MVSTALKAAPPLLAITATIRQQVFAITQPSSVRKRRQGLGVMAMFDIVSAQLANGARRVLTARTARRLIKQQDGAAAVEFALVAAPFLALVFAIMETAVVFFAGQALETDRKSVV